MGCQAWQQAPGPLSSLDGPFSFLSKTCFGFLKKFLSSKLHILDILEQISALFKQKRSALIMEAV